MSRSCDSCGSEASTLAPVRRRYVTPESWENPGSERVLDEVEHWCFSCCSHYPHEPVG